MVRPRYSEVDNDAIDLLNKAQKLLERTESIVKKGSPNFITTFSTEPQDVTFVAESGGQTRNAYYTSNQHLLDSEDVANKGATSYAYNLDTLSPTVNTHDRPFESHEITSGGESKTNE